PLSQMKLSVEETSILRVQPARRLDMPGESFAQAAHLDRRIELSHQNPAARPQSFPRQLQRLGRMLHVQPVEDVRKMNEVVLAALARQGFEHRRMLEDDTRASGR